jgi:hypothetical protein
MPWKAGIPSDGALRTAALARPSVDRPTRRSLSGGKVVSVAGPDAWTQRLGRIWAKALRGYDLGPTSTVVEIGPGFAAKIGCGLAELNYRGTVILVEPNETARAFTVQQYEKLLPRATIVPCDLPVPDATFLAGRSIDLIAANHVLDDLLLNAYLPAQVGSELFAGMRPREESSTAFVQAWHELLSTPASFKRLAARVANDLFVYINASQPRLVLLYQYRSGHHVETGLRPIHPHTIRVMRLLRDQLSADAIGAREVLLLRDQSAGWLVVRPRGLLSSAQERAVR